MRPQGPGLFNQIYLNYNLLTNSSNNNNNNKSSLIPNPYIGCLRLNNPTDNILH